jgi:DnaK suppressor protein
MRKRDLEKIQKDLLEMKAKISSGALEMGDKDLSSDREDLLDSGDVATVELSQSFKIRLREREEKLLKKTEGALQRIKEGTYGICEECGEEIEVKRLIARPVTTLCIDCKSRQEAEEKSQEQA